VPFCFFFNSVAPLGRAKSSCYPAGHKIRSVETMLAISSELSMSDCAVALFIPEHRVDSFLKLAVGKSLAAGNFCRAGLVIRDEGRDRPERRRRNMENAQLLSAVPFLGDSVEAARRSPGK
jgi:hypothetical protein